MKNEKQFLRKKIMAELEKIERPQYEHDSYLIAKNLYQDPYWKESKTIGITISKQPEVDTYQIIRKAWEEGKQIVIPKCLPKLREMVFRTFSQFDQLESVYSGLFEPIVAETSEVFKNDIDLIIVPGLAFTEKGYRLGFGGGYYDRYLTDYNGRTASLAFLPQLVSDLPVDDHDLAVQKIITTSKVLSIYD